MGAGLLRRSMAARAELDLSSSDRFFPSQDFLLRVGVGNLIAPTAPMASASPGAQAPWSVGRAGPATLAAESDTDGFS